ncbi:MAG: LysM peptidoglycan-binding domain-containing protein [Bacteroidales bacterium]|nr:LysM peptidoglycan-binding domain-containing protein [Bacteroidales bacterium]
MKKLQIICSLIGFLFSASISAQAKLDLPQKTLGGEAYYYYKVKGNESVEGIARQLGITAQDVVKYNPSAAQGIAKKQLLFFPVADFSASSKATATSTVASKKVTHLVKKGQSLYGIAKVYNVSVDELVAANPDTRNGLKEGQVIVIPVAVTAATQSTPEATYTSQAIFHTIQKGESMYSVAKQYNTTIENLIATNPGIYPNNFIEGDVVKVLPNTASSITIKRDIKQMVSHVAVKGETFESIAAANGLTVAQLKAANPEMKKVKKGNIVYIPKDGQSLEQVNSSQASVKELENTYSSKIDDIYASIHKTKSDGLINIAIMLPFQLHKQNPPRQAYLYTDFYKGFLLAVDSIGNQASKKINVHVFDTQHNLNTTDSILSLPELKNMDVIIAPSEPKQLERCNNFGLKNNIYVINCFSSKNEDYASNPSIIQLNMPTSYLASAVNQLISADFSDYEVIFLKDATSQETEIIPEIKQHLKSHNIKSHTIDILNAIEFETISAYMDPGSNYLFIPTSTSKQFFAKFAKALKDAKDKRFDCEVRLLGHPEYLSMKEIKASLQGINSFVYSRFFVASKSRGSVVETKFKAAYEENMIATTPSMGILGFDLGTYLISTMANHDSFATQKSYFDGVQMDIELQRSSNWGGYINKCVELVHFTESGVTEKIIK